MKFFVTCPDIKILTDEAEETDITSIEQVEDDFYVEPED